MMQFEEILEENTIPSIHKRTKISIENLTKLFQRDFSGLKKVQAYGFLSILEREYNVDIAHIKAECEEYFESNQDNEESIIAYPLPKKSSKFFWIWIILIVLLIALGWFFVKEYYTPQSSINKQKNTPVADAAPLIEDDVVTSLVTVTKEEQNQDLLEDINQTDSGDTISDIHSEVDFVQIVPKNKLWFGMLNLETKKTIDKIIEAPFEIDIKKGWLMATSVAHFSIKSSSEEKLFDDAKVHYFHVDKFGAKEITKDEFVSLGGPKKW